MKCVIPGQNVKIIARIIHSLSRIGDELYIEPAENELIFCTLSVAQSAMCQFKMCHSFFSSYNFTPPDKEANCKVTMKSCLGVFKSPHCADKGVESCELKLQPEGVAVIFYIKFSNSSTKKHFLPIIESEKLEVSFNRDVPNKCITPSKLLSSLLKNFRTAEEELTLSAAADKMTLKNHLELNRDSQLMRTELSFHPAEFDCYTVNNPTSITFCLKEFRAVSGFAEASNLPVTIQFSNPGDPVIFYVANLPAYEATYVVSTLRSNFSGTVSPQLSTSKINDRTKSGKNSLSESHRNDVFQFDSDVDNLGEQTPRTSAVKNSKDQTSSQSLRNNVLPDCSSGQTSAVVDSSALPIETPQKTVLPADNPYSQLIQIVFQKCFRKHNILESLPGHDKILVCSSDTE